MNERLVKNQILEGLRDICADLGINYKDEAVDRKLQTIGQVIFELWVAR